MKTPIVLTILLVACGDNIDPSPDAGIDGRVLPSCASLGCEPWTYDRECASTGYCFCPVEGERTRCER